jgi:hypothetical protein
MFLLFFLYLLCLIWSLFLFLLTCSSYFLLLLLFLRSVLGRSFWEVTIVSMLLLKHLVKLSSLVFIFWLIIIIILIISSKLWCMLINKLIYHFLISGLGFLMSWLDTFLSLWMLFFTHFNLFQINKYNIIYMHIFNLYDAKYWITGFRIWTSQIADKILQNTVINE